MIGCPGSSEIVRIGQNRSEGADCCLGLFRKTVIRKRSHSEKEHPYRGLLEKEKITRNPPLKKGVVVVAKLDS